MPASASIAKARARARAKTFARNNPGAVELRKLIRQTGGLPAEVRKELRPALRAAGQRALQATRARSSWSRRIPKATRLTVSFSKRRAGLSITVDRRRAPNARPLENRGRSGMIRHPVFGNRRVWVSQPARPFLAPAVRPLAQHIDADIARAVETVARKHGFK